jgi:hypothetical protein
VYVISLTKSIIENTDATKAKKNIPSLSKGKIPLYSASKENPYIRLDVPTIKVSKSLMKLFLTSLVNSSINSKEANITIVVTNPKRVGYVR